MKFKTKSSLLIGAVSFVAVVAAATGVYLNQSIYASGTQLGKSITVVVSNSNSGLVTGASVEIKCGSFGGSGTTNNLGKVVFSTKLATGTNCTGTATKTGEGSGQTSFTVSSEQETRVSITLSTALRISGAVTNSKTGKGIPFAQVKLGSAGAMTDMQGNYFLISMYLSPGDTINISASARGYKSASQLVELTGQTNTVNFSLEPIAGVTQTPSATKTATPPITMSQTPTATKTPTITPIMSGNPSF